MILYVQIDISEHIKWEQLRFNNLGIVNLTMLYSILGILGQGHEHL